MESLAFRAATEADIPALVALVTSAYRGDASRAGWTTEADMLDGQRIDPEVLRQNVAAYAVYTYLAAQAEGGFGSSPAKAQAPDGR